MEISNLMKKAVNFHGHICPGLTVGVLVSKYILDHGNDFSVDEELVAVVENDNCSVDALQALLGTTFGKGNLIHKDYGKNNYTFYNRTNQKAIKLSIRVKDFGGKELTREKRVELLLNSNPEEIFNITEVEYDPPERAQIHDSIICSNCKELTMSTRIRKINNKELCIPCYEELKKDT